MIGTVGDMHQKIHVQTAGRQIDALGDLAGIKRMENIFKPGKDQNIDRFSLNCHSVPLFFTFVKDFFHFIHGQIFDLTHPLAGNPQFFGDLCQRMRL